MSKRSLIISLLSLLLIAGYLIFPKLQNTPSLGKFLNQPNVYKDEENMFSFVYPEGWFVDKNLQDPKSVSFFTAGIPVDYSFGDHKGSEVSIIRVSPRSKSIEEYISEYPQSQKFLDKGEYKILKIDNYNAIVFLPGEKVVNFYINSERVIVDIDTILDALKTY